MKTHQKITEAIQIAFRAIREMDADVRNVVGCNTLAGIREYVQIDLEDVRKEIASEAEPAFVTPDYDSHCAAFWCATKQVPEWARATEAQVEYLARLAVQAGDKTTYNGRLTKQAASNLINDYLKGAGK